MGRNRPTPKGKFHFPPSTKEALIVDWGALPKTFKIDPQRAVRYLAIGREDAERVRRVTTGMVEGERLTTLTTRDMENLLRPFGMTAHSVKRGALAQAAAAVIEHDLGPRLLAQLGKRADPPEPPRSTARYIGPWVALVNKAAHLTAYM
ncbi:trans-sialidase [Trypanosoma grayi]|uniref:trans-sialidase n=1 Tax=Trypanosoma grayi TaxID=71804 RepID=UPI0004F40294|nr:trans-sialidase [Trypanosoma grayi]KEG06909.1 trans-sialidase [Trypanosoma grayi]